MHSRRFYTFYLLYSVTIDREILSYNQNIFSVPVAIDKGVSITLVMDYKTQFKAPNGTSFDIQQRGRLFYLNSVSSQNNATTLMEWHKIKGHCNFHDLQKLQNVEGMKIVDNRQRKCAICTERQNLSVPEQKTGRESEKTFRICSLRFGWTNRSSS